MSAADEIIADLPMAELAQQLGTDEATAEQAVRSALPALFGGLQTNVATDDAGPQSLAQALTQHSNPQFFEGGIDLNQVDTSDGEAIVRHIFANSPEQAQVLQASSAGGAGGDLLKKLLPILAPIVMAYIAKKLNMGGQQGQATSSGQAGSAQQGGLGGLGDLLGPILGGLFGGAGAAGSTGSAGGGFGDILGQILGGQTPQAPQVDDGQASGQQFPSGGQAQQPQFNPTGSDDGRLRMPTVEEDPADEGNQQQRSDGGIGDILGGLFGR